jgi:hypothetical protein
MHMTLAKVPFFRQSWSLTRQWSGNEKCRPLLKEAKPGRSGCRLGWRTHENPLWVTFCQGGRAAREIAAFSGLPKGRKQKLDPERWKYSSAALPDLSDPI